MYGTERGKLDTVVYSTDQTVYSISSLEEFKEYFVAVFAETSVSGSQSNTVQATTFEDGKLIFDCCCKLLFLYLNNN